MDIQAELEALKASIRDLERKAVRQRNAELADAYWDCRERVRRLAGRLPPDAVVVRDVGEKGVIKSNRFLVQPQGPWHEGWNACRRAMIQAAEENSDDRG